MFIMYLTFQEIMEKNAYSPSQNKKPKNPTNSKKENVIEICGQIAKEYDDPELHEALDRCAKNATNLTFDEFESIMTRKAYP